MRIPLLVVSPALRNVSESTAWPSSDVEQYTAPCNTLEGLSFAG